MTSPIFFIIFIMISIFVILAVPIVAIIIREISGRDRLWVCPTCGKSSNNLFCGGCGASMTASPSYGGFSKRLAAGLIDSAILFLPILVLSLPGDFLHSPILVAVSRIIATLVGVGYVLWFTTRYGKTPGKHIIGLRIVTTDFKKIGVVEAVLRNFPYILCDGVALAVLIINLANVNASQFSLMTWAERMKVADAHHSMISLILSVTVIVDTWIMLIDPRKRALHDSIAGTVVIDEKTLQPGVLSSVKFRWIL